MLEKDLIQTRGFHSIKKDGRVVGVQFCVRLTYYRGIFLSQLRPQKVVLDGVVYPKDKVIWEIGGREYTCAEMEHESSVSWCPTETAVLKLYRDGGIEPGYHEITTGYKYSSSYMPPRLQEEIDSEEVSPFLEMMFGQLHSTRRLLLVW